MIERVSNAAEISNIEEACFRNRKNVLSIRQIFIKENPMQGSEQSQQARELHYLVDG